MSTVVSAGMKAGQVTMTFAAATRVATFEPKGALQLAEELARLAHRCVNGTEPPTTRSVLAAEIRKRAHGEVLDELIKLGLQAADRATLTGEPVNAAVVESIAKQMAKVT